MAKVDSPLKPPGQLLKEARAKSNKKQTAIATELGVSQPAVSRWEKGDAVPSDLEAAARVYGISHKKLAAAFIAERQRKAAA